MNFSEIPLVSMINARLSWLGQRQQVLADNVANAETPGYQPKDLRPLEFRNVLAAERGGATQLATTHPVHLPGSAASRGFELAQAGDAEVVDATGNSVLLEDELVKVSKTASDYQLTTGLYRKTMSMVRTALGRPGA